ncbi:MAG: DUF3375 domain-containing protein [Verrucomicrobiales bacterium]
MTYLEVKQMLRHPSASLMRKNQAAFILSFLHAAFKQPGLVQVENEVLRARLSNWLDQYRGSEEFEAERGAREYLEEWCSERCGWLRRSLPPATQVPVFELTAATEKALRWLEELRGSTFIGTESRMESIFAQIDSLLTESSADVGLRLEALRDRLRQTEAEIDRIERTGEVRVLDARQVRERFLRLIEEARTLMSEFRQVEENFREVARVIIERQTDQAATRGHIMGGVLDSHDTLRESPQGQSFYGFVRLLMDPARRETFEDQAMRVQQLPQLEPDDRNNQLLVRLLSVLRLEQEKVGDSTRRLASNLRRALESSQLSERRRIRELVGEVQQLAFRAKDRPPSGGFFEIAEPVPVWASQSRPLWNPPNTLKSGGLEGGDVQEIDAATLGALGRLAHLSLDKLRRQIEASFGDDTWISLRAVLGRFPPEHGVLEVLGYLVIAARHPERHDLPWDRMESFEIDGARWRLPAVSFGKEESTLAAS